MDGAGHFAIAEHRHHTLDLAPAAEVDEVAKIAASPGALGRFAQRIIAERLDKLGGLGQSGPAGEMDVVTQGFPFRSLPQAVAPTRCQNAQGKGLMSSLACTRGFWQSRAMEPARNNQAGGFVLAACIIGGTVAGAILHQASLGFLIGHGAGILLAVIIWMIDRAR